MTALIKAEIEAGPQKHISNRDLHLFWKQQFRGQFEVPWCVRARRHACCRPKQPIRPTQMGWPCFAFLACWLHNAPPAPQQPAINSCTLASFKFECTPALLPSFTARCLFKNPSRRHSFWQLFPHMLLDTSSDKEMVGRLRQLLCTSDARACFERAIELDGHPASVSVCELGEEIINNEEDLDVQVKRLVEKGEGKLLPQVDAFYRGRAEDAKRFVRHLERTGSLALVAQGGMGKSMLAADVSGQLHRARVLMAAPVLVDLREARTKEDVQARFCSALYIEAVSQGAGVLGAGGGWWARGAMMVGNQQAIAMHGDA